MVVSLLLLALGKGAPQSSPSTRTYLNARYAYAIDVPSTLRLTREADNGDGRTYASKSGSVQLAVYGSHLLLDEKGRTTESLEAAQRRWLAAFRQKDAGLYSANRSADQFTVLGEQRGGLVHVRTIALAQGFATVHIQRDHGGKSNENAALTRCVNSLRRAKR